MSGPVHCEYFVLCENHTTKSTRHPILGNVPTCEACESRHISLGGDPAFYLTVAYGDGEMPEMLGLVPGSRVNDDDGDVWTRHTDGYWLCEALPSMGPRSCWALVHEFGPLHLVDSAGGPA